MAEQCAVTLGTKIASVVQVSGAPLTGFNSLPAAPVSLLSIRGRSDSVIPATTNVAKNTDKSICPQGCDTEGLVSNNGLYYVPEVDVARTWAVGARCSELESRDWVPTVQLPNSNISFNQYFSKIHGKCTRWLLYACFNLSLLLQVWIELQLGRCGGELDGGCGALVALA